MAVALPDNVLVIGLHKASVADISSNKFIARPRGRAHGALVAEEIHIFPEDMRGTAKAIATGTSPTAR